VADDSCSAGKTRGGVEEEGSRRLALPVLGPGAPFLLPGGGKATCMPPMRAGKGARDGVPVGFRGKGLVVASQAGASPWSKAVV